MKTKEQLLIKFMKDYSMSREEAIKEISRWIPNFSGLSKSAAMQFDESKHKRDGDGKFAEKEETGNKGEESNKLNRSFEPKVHKYNDEVDKNRSYGSKLYGKWEADRYRKWHTKVIEGIGWEVRNEVSKEFMEKHDGIIHFMANENDEFSWAKNFFDGVEIDPNNTHIIKIYKEFVKDLKNESPEFKKMVDHINESNKTNKEMHDKFRRIWRGGDVDELASIVNNNGEVGRHRRQNVFDKTTEFVSTSLHTGTPYTFSQIHKNNGILFQYDTTGMSEDEAKPLTYDFGMNYTIDANPPFPHEKFNGKYTPRCMHQTEIQLKIGSKPKLKSIHVQDNISGYELERAYKLVRQYNEKTGSKVEIYIEDRKQWKNPYEGYEEDEEYGIELENEEDEEDDDDDEYNEDEYQEDEEDDDNDDDEDDEEY